MKYTTDWLDYFKGYVEHAASKSHCVRRKVGAVLVKDKRIIATGYNGLPSGFPNCQACFGGGK